MCARLSRREPELSSVRCLKGCGFFRRATEVDAFLRDSCGIFPDSAGIWPVDSCFRNWLLEAGVTSRSRVNPRCSLICVPRDAGGHIGGGTRPHAIAGPGRVSSGGPSAHLGFDSFRWESILHAAIVAPLQSAAPGRARKPVFHPVGLGAAIHCWLATRSKEWEAGSMKAKGAKP